MILYFQYMFLSTGPYIFLVFCFIILELFLYEQKHMVLYSENINELEEGMEWNIDQENGFCMRQFQLGFGNNRYPRTSTKVMRIGSKTISKTSC